jgi:hypothetical protein
LPPLFFSTSTSTAARGGGNARGENTESLAAAPKKSRSWNHGRPWTRARIGEETRLGARKRGKLRLFLFLSLSFVPLPSSKGTTTARSQAKAQQLTKKEKEQSSVEQGEGTRERKNLDSWGKKNSAFLTSLLSLSFLSPPSHLLSASGREAEAKEIPVAENEGPHFDFFFLFIYLHENTGNRQQEHKAQ